MFTRFFYRRHREKGTTHFLDELEGLFLAPAPFLARLRQERLRSERSNLPLSLVVIVLDPLLDLFAQKTELSPRRVLRGLGFAMLNMTREYDVKGWYREREIAVITPDTDESGAQTVVKNITKNLITGLGMEDNYQNEMLRHFVVHTLDGNRNYLDNNNRSKASFATSHKDFLVQSSLPDKDQDTTFFTPSTDGGVVAIFDWPITNEILGLTQMHDLQLRLKRIIDIVGSLTGIILSAPLMLVIAIFIKLTSPGPVLFRQERLSYLGKPFTFLKFRTMRADCDVSLHREYVTKLIKGEDEATNENSEEQPLYKMIDDPRITLVGKFLRKSSLDELPQFFNVLKGEMSLVGPRPPIPYECDHYKRWHCRRVLEVKPGITGLWQISGRSITTFDEMVRLDLTYVRNWNLWLDLKIILRTFWAVISTKGGY
jgi:lipopolysaccharide/colanic/teichoic acid biosynthesis glycosyltransferase/GGDEF domain-containing protein